MSWNQSVSLLRPACLDRSERDEGGPQVAHPREQPVQFRLVGDNAPEPGGAVKFASGGEPTEPHGPVIIEVAREADLVAGHLVVMVVLTLTAQ